MVQVKTRDTMRQMSTAARRGDRKALGDTLDALIEGTHGRAADSNVHVGPHSLEAITSGTANTALGDDTLLLLTTGADNVAVGAQAMDAATISVRCVAVGKNALSVLTTGTDNVAVGSGALQNATTAVENVAIGTDALNSNISGINNVAVGDDALEGVTDGDDNLGIGRDAGLLITTGDKNLCIGSGAGNVTTTGSRNICIGVDCDPEDLTAEDQYVIGHGLTGTADKAVLIGDGSDHVRNDWGSDATWDKVSDERMKNIQGLSHLGLAFITMLNPIEYFKKPTAEWPEEWGIKSGKETNTTTRLLGLRAQEVKAAMDAVGVTVFGGWKQDAHGAQRVGEAAFVYPLITAVKELAEQNAVLTAKVDALNA